MKNKSVLFAFIAGCLLTSAVFTLIGHGIFTQSPAPISAARPSAAMPGHMALTAPKQSQSGEFMSWTAFSNAKQAYAKANPTAVQGGSISKSYIQEILNGMGPEQSSLAFYFGSDNGKTYVMFVAANANPAANPPVYKNTSYCPTVCE